MLYIFHSAAKKLSIDRSQTKGTVFCKKGSQSTSERQCLYLSGQLCLVAPAAVVGRSTLPAIGVTIALAPVNVKNAPSL